MLWRARLQDGNRGKACSSGSGDGLMTHATHVSIICGQHRASSFFFAVQEFGMFGWPDWSAKQVRFSRKKISHCMSMSSSADERVASSWLDISQSTWAGLGQNLGNTHPNKMSVSSNRTCVEGTKLPLLRRCQSRARLMCSDQTLALFFTSRDRRQHLHEVVPVFAGDF